jgi:hypothetical protein
MTAEERFKTDEFEDLLTELIGVYRDNRNVDPGIWSDHMESVRRRIREYAVRQVGYAIEDENRRLREVLEEMLRFSIRVAYADPPREEE